MGVDELVEAVVDRALRVTSDPVVGEEVRLKLLGRLESGEREQEQVGAQPGYREERGTVKGLLGEPKLARFELFYCPSSLRETEPTVNLIIGRLPPRPVPRRCASVLIGCGRAPSPVGDR